MAPSLSVLKRPCPGGGGGESHVVRLNFKEFRAGVHKCFTSLSFVEILVKGDSDVL